MAFQQLATNNHEWDAIRGDGRSVSVAVADVLKAHFMWLIHTAIYIISAKMLLTVCNLLMLLAVVREFTMII